MDASVTSGYTIVVERYTPGFIEDMSLLAWWLHLGETGDLERCFSRTAACLTVFTRLFDEPTELYFARDDNGWFAASWITPLMDGATYSLWLREDKRQSREALQFIHMALQTALAKYPVVLFVTRAEGVMRQSQAFGFTVLGEVPYLFDGDSAWVGVVTPFAYESTVNTPKEHTNGR